MARNSGDLYAEGQFFNLVLDLLPSQRHRIFMRSVPGFADGMTDFFLTGAGTAGTETTLGGCSDCDPDEKAAFFRVREATRCSDDLDEFTHIMHMREENRNGCAPGGITWRATLRTVSPRPGPCLPPGSRRAGLAGLGGIRCGTGTEGTSSGPRGVERRASWTDPMPWMRPHDVARAPGCYTTLRG